MSDSVKMNFRTDSSFNPSPPAKPGDVWRVRWYKEGGGTGPIAGYTICCLGCGQVHLWTSSNNCSSRVAGTGVCSHSGASSCWDWSGSAEDGTLTAHPSLQVSADDCNWHGWLQNGVLHT